MNNLGANFYPKLVQIASELGMRPEDILAIMVSESGLNPSSLEKKYHGSGLIGFMPQTLDQLGFKGTWQDFTKTSGEDQLDYVKKYIQSKIAFNGGPFKSAAQYYVANFYPVALKLPGIKAGDPGTAFLEEHPQTVTVNGRTYSKKYYDIGYHISPESESGAYKANPLFHGDTPGAITYGDMMRQVDKTRNSNLYKQAIAAMTNSTGYQSSQNVAENITPKPQSYLSSFIAKLEKLLSMFSLSSYSNNNFLISVGSSSDYATTMEYARVLSTALEEYLKARTRVCANKNNIEIECKVFGDQQILFEAIKELSMGISDAFRYSTKKLGNITTFALVTADLESDYEPLHPKRADLYSRLFQLKFVRSK